MANLSGQNGCIVLLQLLVLLPCVDIISEIFANSTREETIALGLLNLLRPGLIHIPVTDMQKGCAIEWGKRELQK